MSEIKDDFLGWVKDDSYFSEYDAHELLDPLVLIRVYCYQPKKRGVIRDLEGKPLAVQRDSRIIPIAKVIKVGPGVEKDIKAGDLVTVADEISGSKVNPEWEMYLELSKERPAPEMTKPPKFIGNITNWRRYLFIGDKFREEGTFGDAFTFLVPEILLKSRYHVNSKKNELRRKLKEERA